MMGIEDADLAIINYPYVHPQNEEVAYELFVRRALASGTIPNIGGNFHHNSHLWVVPGYARFGVTAGPFGYGGYTLNNGVWWPPVSGRATWGRIGDGMCHTDKTRSGSSPVHSRNWHPGVWSTLCSSRAFLCARACLQICECVSGPVDIKTDRVHPVFHPPTHYAIQVHRVTKAWLTGSYFST
jgi:hypothetical protein